MELFIHFLKAPAQPEGVLAHLQPGGGHATGVGRLGGGKEDPSSLEHSHRLGRRGHICSLGHGEAAVSHQRLGAVAIQLVLGGAGQGHVALHAPDALAALHILGGGDIVQIGLDARPLDFLDLLDDLVINTRLIHDIAVGIGHGNDLGPQLGGLLVGVDGHVARAGDDHPGALKGLSIGLEHLVGKVAKAVAGSLGPGQGATEGNALAGKDAAVLVLKALELAKHIADLPATHADISGGNVGKLADMTLQLSHKGLAEAHDLSVGLALGVKVGAALAAAHGQSGEAVLEYLLKAQELDNGQVHTGMEPQTALVGADGRVELHPVAPVHLDLATVVHPRHPEHHDALRLHQPLDDTVLLQLRAALHHRLQRLQHLLYSLEKLRLMGALLGQIVVDLLQISVFQCHIDQTPFE